MYDYEHNRLWGPPHFAYLYETGVHPNDLGLASAPGLAIAQGTTGLFDMVGSLPATPTPLRLYTIYHNVSGYLATGQITGTYFPLILVTHFLLPM